MTTFAWPHRLLRPKTWKVRLVNQTISGGTLLSGDEQTGLTDAGGRWLAELKSIVVRDRDQIQCLRAWAGHLRGGGVKLIVPCPDLGQAPRPMLGDKLGLPDLAAPAADGDWFNQPVGFGGAMMVATVAADAVLGASSLQITLTRGSRLVGGQHFSIQHANADWRMYLINRVTGQAGNVYTVEIGPFLNEGVAEGDPVEFDVPRFVAKARPSTLDDLWPDLEMGRRATVNAAFLETPEWTS